MKLINRDLLRGLITETGLTYRGLAEPFGVSHSHLANVIAGRRSLSRDSAERICQYLKVDCARLFADDSADDNPSIA